MVNEAVVGPNQSIVLLLTNHANKTVRMKKGSLIGQAHPIHQVQRVEVERTENSQPTGFKGKFNPEEIVVSPEHLGRVMRVLETTGILSQ